MTELAYLHPMLVHFPLVLMPLVVLLQIVGLIRGVPLFGRDCLARSLWWLTLAAALGALAAALLGDPALDIAVERGFPEAKLEDHEALGQTSAGLMLALAFIHGLLYLRQTPSRGGPGLTLLIVSSGILLILLTTAFYGGNLVYALGVNVVPALPGSGVQ